MKSISYRILLCAMVIALTFALSANIHAAGVEDSIIGDWECVVEAEDAEGYVFFLYFAEPNDVTYVAGWYMSEIAAMYAGQFTIENDVLTLDMTDTESADTLSGSYAFSVSEGVLTLTNQGGDCLTDMFGAGVPMVFRAVDNSLAGFLAQVKLDEAAWQTGAGDNKLPILAFEYLMISGDDAETLIAYGFDPDAGYDYEIAAISTEWAQYEVTADTQIILYKFDDEGVIITWEGTLNELKDKLLEALETDGYIWAELAVSESGEALKIEEIYIP